MSRKSTLLRCASFSGLFLFVAAVFLTLRIPRATAAGGGARMPSVKDLPVQASLPDPLINNKGEKVATPEQWQQRREEMKEILEEYEFGHAPPPPGNVKGQDLQSASLLEGRVVYRLAHLSFGPGEKLGFEIGIFTPGESNEQKSPFPTIIHLTFFSVGASSATTNASNTNRAARGAFRAPSAEDIARQYEEPLKRGYAVVAINYQQLGGDSTNYRSTAFFPAYPQYDWNDIAAWAWGVSRCVDYLQGQPFADKSKLIAVGHSRVGQAILLAGAFDERIALVAPAGAGCAFRFSGKGRGGKQGLDEVVDQNTFWFGPRFAEFRGQVEKLPFDQHWLLALAAPRYYILCNALDDQYGNANAAAQSYLAAKPVYALLGASDNLGVNFRPGRHALAPSDWQAILDFADQKLLKKPVDRRFDQLPPADQLH